MIHDLMSHGCDIDDLHKIPDSKVGTECARMAWVWLLNDVRLTTEYGFVSNEIWSDN